MQPDDPRIVPDGIAFREYPNYTPTMNPGTGTFKPGTTPENSPLEAILDMETPHQAPHYQEVPFNIRWTESHPASTPFMMWLEEKGMVLTVEEEEEIDKRGRRAQARAQPKKPGLVKAEDIQAELFGADSDEALMAEALGAIKVDAAGDAIPDPKPKRGSLKPKTSWSGSKEAEVLPVPVFDDEALLKEAFGSLDFTDLE